MIRQVTTVSAAILVLATFAGAVEAQPKPASNPAAAAAAVPSAVDSGASAVVEDKVPVTRPSRPVAILAELRYCSQLSGDLQTTCLRGAGETLEAGIRFQACQWQMSDAVYDEPNKVSNCSGLEARPLPKEFQADGQKLLQDGRDFAKALREGKLDATALAKLRSLAVLFVNATRGQYSLVSQGGVSLGSWQAGYVYYLSEVLKTRRDVLNEPLAKGAARAPALKTLTGASAGAINAFAAGIESCRTSRKNRDGVTVLSPESSLFYQVWVNKLDLLKPGGLFPEDGELSTEACVGEDQKDADRTAKYGLFSKKPLCEAVKLAKAELETADTEPGCSFNYGLSLTHLHAVTEPVVVEEDKKQANVLIEAKRLTEYVALRVTPSGDAGASVKGPKFSNLARNQEHRKLQPIELRTGKEGIPLESVLQAVRASGAFPVAFPPVHLAYKTYNPKSKKWVDRDADFVDGGTLDNTPVALAGTLNDWTPDESPNPWLTDLLPHPDSYFVVNPNVVSWKEEGADKRTKTADEQELFGKYLDFAGELLTTGAEAQLVNAARQLDWLGTSEANVSAPQALVPKRNLPIAGAQFAHFMAFLEKDFRVFDFYVGMMDAMVHLKRVTALNTYNQQLAELFKALPALEGKRFNCLYQYYEQKHPDTYYDATEPDAESKLERELSLLSNDGRGNGEGATSSSVPTECNGEELANFRAMLVAMHNLKIWSISKKVRSSLAPASSEVSASEFDQFFDELRLADYKFTNANEEFADDPRFAFRNEFQRAIGVLADKHSSGLTSLALTTGGRVAADAALVRTFPKAFWYVGYALNGAEGGWSRTLWNTNKDALRFDTRLRAYRLGSKRIDADDKEWGGDTSLYAGVTFSDDLLSFPASLPAGVLDWEASFGVIGNALVLPGADEPLAMARFGFDAGLGAVLLQQLYFKFDFELYPSNPGRRLWLNDQYAGTWLEDDIRESFGRGNFAVGWRFLP